MINSSKPLSILKDFSAGNQWFLKSINTGRDNCGWNQLLSFKKVIFSLGGFDEEGRCLNEIYKSIDEGISWFRINDPPWAGRAVFGSCCSTNGSVMYVMGGSSELLGGFCNDVWKSEDQGFSWTCMTTSAQWVPRSGFSCNVSTSNSNEIIIVGGTTSNSICLNDVWKSLDGGFSWSCLNEYCTWSPRIDFCLFSLLDKNDTLILVGGDDWEGRFFNDVWKSSDRGKTWNLISSNNEWVGRAGHCVVGPMADGSFILVGGNSTGLTPSPDTSNTLGPLHSHPSTPKLDDSFEESPLTPTPTFSLLNDTYPSFIHTPPPPPTVKKLNDIWVSHDYCKSWFMISSSSLFFSPRTLMKIHLKDDRMGFLMIGGWQDSLDIEALSIQTEVWETEIHFKEIKNQKSILSFLLDNISSRLKLNEDIMNNVINYLIPEISN